MSNNKKKAKAETKGKKPVKEKIKDKVTGKLKSNGMTAAVVGMFALMFVMAGCQTADPSSQRNSAEYGDIRVTVNGNHNNVTVDIGDGVVSTAEGSAIHNTPTQTTDVKPETSVAWGGSTAGTGGGSSSSIVTRAIGKVWGWLTGTSEEKLDAEEVNALKDCVGNNCEL